MVLGRNFLLGGGRQSAASSLCPSPGVQTASFLSFFKQRDGDRDGARSAARCCCSLAPCLPNGYRCHACFVDTSPCLLPGSTATAPCSSDQHVLLHKPIPVPSSARAQAPKGGACFSGSCEPCLPDSLATLIITFGMDNYRLARRSTCQGWR